jgi:hypothetical protein
VYTKVAGVILMGALLVTGANAKAEELRIKQWPDGVPCAALTHKSDGSWMLTDSVIGPDGNKHYPSSDRDSFENRSFRQRCK